MSNDDFDPGSVTWVNEPADLGHLLAAIEQAALCVIDLETTGLNEHSVRGGQTNGGVAAKIALASLTLPESYTDKRPTTWVVPLFHPQSPFQGTWRAVLQDIVLALVEHETDLINQNMKFDARWIYRHTRVDLSHLIKWDTRVSSFLLDETESTKLKERAPATFNVPRWDDFDLTYPGAALDVPLFDLGLYAARDTYWTWRLAELHLDTMWATSDGEPLTPDEVENARLGQLARTVAMPSVAALTAVEQRGIELDVEWTRDRLAANQTAERELFEHLSGMYAVDHPGPPSFAPTSHYFAAWTEAAIEKRHLRVVATTKTGKAQWTKEVLGRLIRGGSEVAAKLLEYRKLVKQNEYLTSWLQLVTENGRIHTTYNAGVVVTGRLSSSSPNMQQVTKALRPAFVPSLGCVIADFDLSQIELRVAAFLSRSEPMMKAFRDGLDLHSMLAANITGKPIGEVTPEERQKGKSANFGLLFDMGPGGFQIYAENAYGVVMTYAEAEQVHQAFFNTWTGLREWQNSLRKRARQTGQVTSPLGRVRRIPDMFSDNDAEVAAGERVAINSPVQGMASDIMQIALGLIEGVIPRPGGDHEDQLPLARRGVHVVGTVHDSLVAELPANDWEPLARRVMKLITEDTVAVMKGLHVDFDVPLAVDATVGTRWGMGDIGYL